MTIQSKITTIPRMRTYVSAGHKVRCLSPARPMQMRFGPAQRSAFETLVPKERQSPATKQLNRLQRMADHGLLPTQRMQSVAQRATIAHGPIDGLTADLDTANLDASKQQVDTLWNGGKRKGMKDLYAALSQAFSADAHQNNNKKIRKHIDAYLGKTASDDADSGNSSWYARNVNDGLPGARDQTGLTTVGPTTTAPDHPTNLQAAAIGVRAWQAGDIVSKINWKTVGLHLQGRMTRQEYIDYAVLVPGTAALDEDGKVLAVKAAIDTVAQNIRGGLDFLTAYEGSSYRAATTAPNVFGGLINTGDLIKDKSFWSTSALKLPHKGSDFGTEGTKEAPKVYYIIQGSSGVFLPQYTNFETGVREVLFKDQTIFRVTRIHNYHDATYFVRVQEVDPTTLVAPVTKNPWSGATNP